VRLSAHGEGHRNSDHACDLPVHESVLVRTTHGRENCKIQAADPTVSIEWSELERGHWRAVCQCDYYEPADRRVRLDPNDPSTFRHPGQCEHRYTSDPALLRAILKVRDGAGGGYWWVECGTCECGWQVPLYAEQSVG
jgi:hypothetical protein